MLFNRTAVELGFEYLARRPGGCRLTSEWVALLLPANTPKAIVDMLNADLNRVLAKLIIEGNRWALRIPLGHVFDQPGKGLAVRLFHAVSPIQWAGQAAQRST